MQGLFTVGPDTAIHVIGLAVSLGIAIVGYKIKISVGEVRHEQSNVKAELLASQNAMRLDMDEKHAENKQGLAVHVARDEGEFREFRGTLQAQDKVLDKIVRQLEKISDRQA